MTIRKGIKDVFLRLLLNIVVLFAALQILGFCVRLWPRMFAVAPWAYWVAAVALWSVMACCAFKLVRIPCPRCSKSLGGAALAAVVGIETMNKCSHCGVGFDETLRVDRKSR